jgi:hypothetical protein
VFGEIQLPKVRVEVVLADYVIRGDMQPRGDLISYMNDPHWSFVALRESELFPLALDRRVKGVRQSLTVVNKAYIRALMLLDEDDAQRLSYPVTGRPVIFYSEYFAIQGNLRVSADAPDEDLLDDMHDFYALTEVSIYPLRPTASSPGPGAPLALISRPLLQAYQLRRHEQSTIKRADSAPDS